jgi:hypothetical protein
VGCSAWYAFWFIQLAAVEHMDRFRTYFNHDDQNDERHDMATLDFLGADNRVSRHEITLPSFALE